MKQRNEGERKGNGAREFWGWALIIGFFFTLAAVESSRFVDAGFSNDIDDNETREPSESILLLNTAILRLERLESISADVEFQSSFFGESYLGRGKYKEATLAGSRRPFEKTRFLLDVELVPQKNEDALRAGSAEEDFMTIVCDCDAHAWWSYRNVNGVKTLKRISTEELWDHFQKLNDEDRAKLSDCGVTSLNCGLNSMPGLGGLAGNLRQVSASYDFSPEVKSDDRFPEALKVTGVAREDAYEGMEPFILENVPAEVAVYFDPKDTFPFRFEYYSVITEGKNSVKRLIFSVDYNRNDEPVSENGFQYNQPQSTYIHAEVEYLENLIPDVRL